MLKLNSSPAFKSVMLHMINGMELTINGHTAVMKCLGTCTMTTTCVTTETKNINFFHTDFGAHSLIV